MHDTKERLIRTGELMFRRQGYEGTGLKQVVAEAEAPWGSLYHFFPGGKTQFGAEVLAFAAEHYAKALDELFERIPDPVAAVRRLFEAEVSVLESSDFRNGCPIASVTLDVASTTEPLRLSCATAFAKWVEAIERGLIRGSVPEREAKDLAVFILSALEGAIVLSRASHSAEPLRRTARHVEPAVARALASD